MGANDTNSKNKSKGPDAVVSGKWSYISGTHKSTNMKITRIASILITASAIAFTLSSCKLDDPTPSFTYDELVKEMERVNSEVSLEGNIDFMFLGPDGPMEIRTKSGEKNISNEQIYPELNGMSYLFFQTKGHYADEILSLSLYFQEFDKCSVGTEIKPVRVNFGAFLSNNSFNFTDRIDGKIVVKAIDEKQITLRFIKVIGSIALGDYIMNGDITFDISKGSIASDKK